MIYGYDRDPQWMYSSAQSTVLTGAKGESSALCQSLGFLPLCLFLTDTLDTPAFCVLGMLCFAFLCLLQLVATDYSKTEFSYCLCLPQTLILLTSPARHTLVLSKYYLKIILLSIAFSCFTAPSTERLKVELRATLLKGRTMDPQ